MYNAEAIKAPLTIMPMGFTTENSRLVLLKIQPLTAVKIITKTSLTTSPKNTEVRHRKQP